MTEATESTGFSGGGRTALILDDDADVRASVRRMLELYDFVVLEAEDSREARKVVADHSDPVHVLLCDLVLPGLSGREFANFFMAHNPDSHVLYISGYSSKGSFRWQLESSQSAFLAKPFEIHQLMDALEALLAD